MSEGSDTRHPKQLDPVRLQNAGDVLGSKPTCLIAMWAVFNPGHEDMRLSPTVSENRPPLLPVRPDEPSYDRDLAHPAYRHPVGHLVVERTVHRSIIELMYE